MDNMIQWLRNLLNINKKNSEALRYRRDINDYEKWYELHYHIKAVLEKDGKPPLVTLEDFFEGNNDWYGSIASNLTNHPTTPIFYKTLREIQKRDDVATVQIAIHQILEYETPEVTQEHAEWPYSDTVYIVSTMEKETVEQLVENLTPDEIEEVNLDHIAQFYTNLPEVETDFKIYQIWWD